jgi:predicted DNA-binding transcriptional regulator YafY
MLNLKALIETAYLSMASDPQIIRQWLLLTLLASRRQGLAVRELAEELNVGEKSIRRDLETLRGVGFALEETVGERGRKTWRLPGCEAAGETAD